MANLPDDELGTRIYHIHLTFQGSAEFRKAVGFRNYLRTHPEARDEYAEIKAKASQEAGKLNTKDEMRDTYGKLKEDFIKRILDRVIAS